MKNTTIIASLCILSIISGCTAKKDSGEADKMPRASVQVAQAKLGDIDNMIGTTGSFEVMRDAKVKSTIAGKIEKVFVLEGDAVTKGKVLVTILSQESNAAIAGAYQMLAQATSPIEKQQAEDALHLAERTAAIAKISAPFSGAVIRKFVTEGENIAQEADLFEMVDPQTEYFVADVPVNQISIIHKGDSAIVSIPRMSENPLRGTVAAITPATDPNNQSMQVRIEFRKIPASVSAGAFGTSQIKVGTQKAVILVPKPAIYHDDELDKDFVWRIRGDSLALLTQVQIGLIDSAFVEVISGLKLGDKVATIGGYGLPDSTLVSVVTK